jgi:fructosamine-3-kinase
MSGFSARVAALTGVGTDRLERLAGGDLSQILLARRPDGRCTVAKSGAAIGSEAAMLRALAGVGLPVPLVEGEHDGILLLEYIANDGLFSPVAWADIGVALRRLHDTLGEDYGWPVDYRLGTVELDNRQGRDWPRFWVEQRLIATASVLDRPWRERIAAIAPRAAALLPENPPAAMLHGDLWTGNILVADNRLAALIDPACYFGDLEVDLAMLTLFDSPPDAFWKAYGTLSPGWEGRRAIYQLFPALVHLRLFGATYEAMTERLIAAIADQAPTGFP